MWCVEEGGVESRHITCGEGGLEVVEVVSGRWRESGVSAPPLVDGLNELRWVRVEG